MGYRFEDLEVYQLAREFRRKIYHLAKKLPRDEKFCLGLQMRRAALSVTGRFHFQETIHFFFQARGSLQEVLDDINLCVDQSYDASENLMALKSEGYTLVHKINSYVFYLKQRKQQINQDLTS